MRLIVLAGALLLAVPSAFAGRVPAIESSSIAGARTGLTKAAYKRLLGGPVLVEHLENGYSRLVFTRQRIEVYFHGRADSGVVVGTWG